MKNYILFIILFLFPFSLYGQDIMASPTYGDIELESGFLPDPWIKSLVAGGSVNIDYLGYTGFVSDSPDVDLYYENGSYDILSFSVDSGEDTILLINTPDGDWVYEDDSNGLNPEIRLLHPASGLYNIWVGTYRSSVTDATLYVSESDD